MRFTIDGSQALESQIASDIAQIRAGVVETVGEDALTGLILGGGYGRGEGGVYVVDGEERVYNDYDFFVVVPYSSRQRRKALSRALLRVKARFEPTCGIHVDFGPPMPQSELASLPYELMFMELKAGHHVVLGPDDVLASIPDFDPSRPPLEEGARLFMNRGVGLLMADMLLREKRTLTNDEHEFVVRNMYKALMAMGDGVLFVEGDYDPSYVVRRERVRNANPSDIPNWDRVQQAYESALEFKFWPSHIVPGGQTLQTWYDDTTDLFERVFLWYERRRLGLPALDWAGYMALSVRLPSLRQGSRLKNVYRNIRVAKGALLPQGECFLHPRDRILKRLPSLLHRSAAESGDEALVLEMWESFG